MVDDCADGVKALMMDDQSGRRSGCCLRFRQRTINDELLLIYTNIC